jgi:hypothetical protein
VAAVIAPVGIQALALDGHWLTQDLAHVDDPLV